MPTKNCFLEPQSHRATEPQSHRATEPQSHRATEPQFNSKIKLTKLLNYFVMGAVMFFTLGVSNSISQNYCIDSRWQFVDSLDGFRGNWFNHGCININEQGRNNVPLLNIHSTGIISETHPVMVNIPASIKLTTDSYENGMQTKKFGHSFIDFVSESALDGDWYVGAIKTIDMRESIPGANYYDLNMPSTLTEGGLAFYCSNSMLNYSIYAPREVFRIVNGDMGINTMTLRTKGKLDIRVHNYYDNSRVAFSSDGDNENNSSGNPLIKLYTPVDGNPNFAEPWWIQNSNANGGELNFMSSPLNTLTIGDEDPILHPTNQMTKLFTIKRNGNIGIGVSNPLQKLVVDGMICAKEVRVSLSGSPCWPDYVFDKNYKLLGLDEVENFINKNKHLPDIPNATEIEQNGVELGDMQAKMLRKIEELTLYIIELKKEINQLKSN